MNDIFTRMRGFNVIVMSFQAHQHCIRAAAQFRLLELRIAILRLQVQCPEHAVESLGKDDYRYHPN